MDLNATRKNAEEGNAVAQAVLGSAYLLGEHGLDVDYDEALRWLSLAAEQGVNGAIGLLGDMYAQGLGVERDMDSAVLLYKDSASRGNLNVALILARMYSHGLDVVVDKGEALRWYTVVYGRIGPEPNDADANEAKHYLSGADGNESTLVNLLEADPLPLVRARAATALGHLHMISALPFLIKAAGNALEIVRPTIIWALGDFQEWPEAGLPSKAAVTELLLTFIDEDNDQIREAAAASIGRGVHDTPETRARLWKALTDSYSGVRAQAAYALAGFGDEDLSPKLEWLLLNDEEPSSLYFSAAEYLGDSALLPSVIEAAERWRQAEHYLDFSEDPAIQSAIDYLTAVANGDYDDEDCKIDDDALGDEPQDRAG